MSFTKNLKLRKQLPIPIKKYIGFTLVELAIILVIIGIMATASAVVYLGVLRNAGGKQAVDAQLANLSGSVVAFVKKNNRLPCPDTNGNGFEGVVAGVCPAGVDRGWLPYISLGLSQPTNEARAIYGVYRNSPLADLAVFVDIPTLTNASNSSVSSSFVYFTGDGTVTNGAENCASNVQANPAFIILAAGESRDGAGDATDGVNTGLPGVGRCFSAPARGVDTNFDDRTIAVSFYALMAELNK
jgi:type II secretory pathway pseudopilin PulG